jgi:hypothetical protein
MRLVMVGRLPHGRGRGTSLARHGSSVNPPSQSHLPATARIGTGRNQNQSKRGHGGLINNSQGNESRRTAAWCTFRSSLARQGNKLRPDVTCFCREEHMLLPTAPLIAALDSGISSCGAQPGEHGLHHWRRSEPIHDPSWCSLVLIRGATETHEYGHGFQRTNWCVQFWESRFYSGGAPLDICPWVTSAWSPGMRGVASSGMITVHELGDGNRRDLALFRRRDRICSYEQVIA